ncbi:MAG: TonB family protein [Bacteroidaceae bacterium]|nr:TonB family protein [Bacteroidaceae bacterium]
MKKLFNAMLLCVTFGALFACSEGEFDDSNDNTTVEYTVSIKTNGNGSVAIEGFTGSEAKVLSGSSVTVLAVCPDGYIFQGWYIDGREKSSSLSYTFTVSDNVELTARFMIDDGKGEIYQVVEQQPEFPGGISALNEYLSENTIYPQESIDNNSQGRAYVRFVVNADGSIQYAEIVKSSGDVYLDKEAIRLIESMPNWTPGKQAGKPVRVSYMLPVNFRLR